MVEALRTVCLLVTAITAGIAVMSVREGATRNIILMRASWALAMVSLAVIQANALHRPYRWWTWLELAAGLLGVAGGLGVLRERKAA